MATTHDATISEILNDQVKCPFPIDIIPDRMGINLTSVFSISWDTQDDGQLISLTINFSPQE